jgi:hypothetical protein
VSAEDAVARVKSKLRWRGDAEEERWLQKMGLSLLFAAICLNDLRAVEALLAQPDAAAKLRLVTRKPFGPRGLREHDHRREPFATLVVGAPGLGGGVLGLTPLAAAVAFACMDVLAAVLAARPPAPNFQATVNENWVYPLLNGEVERYRMLQAAYPEARLFERGLGFPFMGISWLHIVCMFGAYRMADVLHFLLEHGGARFVNKKMFALTPLGMSCYKTPLLLAARNPEADAEVCRLLVAHGADVDAKDSVPRALHCVASVLAALRIKWPPLKRMLGMLVWGGTPLHHAAQRGDLALVRTLLELRAAPEKKDKHGRTALDIVRAEFPGSVLVERFEAVLGCSQGHPPANMPEAMITHDSVTA